MELRLLRSFLAVAREQSFTRAAASINVAQPRLSLRIRQLEQELEVRLFDRNTRKVELTAAGRAFRDAIEPLLAQLELAAETCRRADRGEAGVLRIGYSGRASHRLLPQLMQSYRSRYPDVLLDLVGPLPSGALKAKLLEEQLDLALCFLPLGSGLINSRSLATIELKVVLPANHPMADQDKVPLARLGHDPFVGYPSNQGFLLRNAMDDECRRAGFAPRVVRECDNSQVLLCLVAAGTGVSLVPSELEFQEPIAGIVFKGLGRGSAKLRHGLAWRKANTNPALRNLLALKEAGA